MIFPRIILSLSYKLGRQLSADEQLLDLFITGFGIDPASQFVVVKEVLKLVCADYKGSRGLDIDARNIV
jgi:hypothetical protein